ncbi:S8 family serine peptidase [Henriciella sp. AS95]|uniref:S8 family peptidase n=1 Tax=Henriciella sp. AS95 TaxID=3135782 RepID=UPI00317DF4AE
MTTSKRIAAGILAIGLGLTLASCDRTDERMERLSEIGDGVMRQLGGEDVGGPGNQARMENVPVEARAFQGEMQEASPVRVATAPSKFVVGSIVAKPRSMPEPDTVAEAFEGPSIADYDAYVESFESDAVIVVPTDEEIAELQSPSRTMSSDEPSRLDRAMKSRRTITIDPKSREQMAQGLPREVLKDTRTRMEYRMESPQVQIPERTDDSPIIQPAPPAASPIPIPQKSAERRLVMRQDAIGAQVSAESQMIETAQRYGLAANIQRSRSGQMVIEVGSRAMKPTKYGGPDDNVTPWIAEDDEAITCPSGMTPEEISEDAVLATVCVIQDLKASGEFEYVEKDWLYQNQFVRRPKNSGPVTNVAVTPNDPLWSLQWNFMNQGSGDGEIEGGSGFVDFWTKQASQGSPEVVVAIVDTGLEMDHPDIKDSPNVAPGWDMVTDIAMANDGNSRDSDPNDPGDQCPEEFVFEDTFHGTHVAGTVGASVSNNENGVAGGAWNVKIVPVRALGKCGGRLSDINDAIRWAGGLIPEYDELGNEIWNDNPADIINLSIGLFRFCPASMQDAINAVTERGVVVVAAAGNDSVSTQFYAPGGCDNVLSVAAGDARGQIAPYSNYGAEVDVLAPGGDLQRDDNGDGRPDGILSTKHASNCTDPVTNEAITDCYYAYEQGTSMAAPHVSAALALIKSKRPDLTGTALADVLLTALNPRSQEQCSGPCDQYPGAEPVSEGSETCKLPCGAGLLNLSDVNLDE